MTQTPNFCQIASYHRHSNGLQSIHILLHWPRVGGITQGPLHECPWWLVAGLHWPLAQRWGDCSSRFWNWQEQSFPAWAGQRARRLLPHALQCHCLFCWQNTSLLLFITPARSCSHQSSARGCRHQDSQQQLPQEEFQQSVSINRVGLRKRGYTITLPKITHILKKYRSASGK